MIKRRLKMKRGLVLEGGGMRGLFTEGVIDAIKENGIAFDGIIGVSAGALFGCNFKSNQIGRALRYNITYKNDSRYMGLKSFIKTGNFVSAKFAYHTMPLKLNVFDNKAFMADPTEFYLVCTDIESGETVYKQIISVDDDSLEWFRATGSMPIVSTPVILDGKKLLDGGLSDCIPLKYFQDIGFDRNIVVLTQPQGYKKRPTRLTSIFKLLYLKYPKVAECMIHRHEMYNAEIKFIEEQAKFNNTLLIYPDQPLNIGRTEQSEDKMRYIYEQGWNKATSMMNEIKSFIHRV